MVTEAFISHLEKLATHAGDGIPAPQPRQGDDVLSMLEHSSNVAKWYEERKAAAAPFWSAVIEEKKALHEKQMQQIESLGGVLRAMV